MPSAPHVLTAISAKASLPTQVMRLTLPPALAAATAWFEPLPPGPMAKPSPKMVSPITGRRLARNERSATKIPRIEMSGMASSNKRGCD